MAEAIQQTTDLAPGWTTAFPGLAFGNGIGFNALLNQCVIPVEVFSQFRLGKRFAPLRLEFFPAMAHDLQKLPQQFAHSWLPLSSA